MFPGAGAVVYRNDEGEVLGWDSAPYENQVGSDEENLEDYYDFLDSCDED